MLEPTNNDELPVIPGKRYFTIGEVSELCAVKPHVLRYWEQEFPQLKPVKRRGNRRYYQRQDVLTIRQIRSLLYDQGFTIGGARQKMDDEVNGTGASQSTDSEFDSMLVKMISELEEVLTLLEATD
jgi:DNA-binding transcriptional MerR regulator